MYWCVDIGRFVDFIRLMGQVVIPCAFRNQYVKVLKYKNQLNLIC